MNDSRSSDAAQRGFASFSSLASKPPAAVPATREPSTVPPLPGKENSGSASSPAQPAFQQSGFWTAGRKWAAVAAGFIGVAVIASQQNMSSRSSASSTYSTSQSNSYAPSPSVPPPTYRPPVETVSKPAMGTNQVLSRAELRYCLSEKIRLDAMEGIADNRISAHVRNFNALVDDYNSRCGSYRYQRSDMDSAHSDV
jgi:hypothetical protein